MRSTPGGQPRRSLVLCTQMRSGSWMLSDLCQQTGLLGQPEEYFRPDFRHHWSAEWGLDLRQSYSEYVASAVGLTSTPNGVFGVKVHAYQMDWWLRQLRVTWGSGLDSTDAELAERWLPRPSFVRLRRDDVVRQAISYYRAIHSDIWFATDGEDEPPRRHGSSGPLGPVWGEIRYLENGLVGQERLWEALFDRLEVEALELVYEDVSRDPAGALAQVFEHLDLPVPDDLPSGSRLKKQSDATTEHWYEEYRSQRDRVLPVAPRRQRRAAQDDGGEGPAATRVRRGGTTTTAATLYPDRGDPPPALGPAGYLEGRTTWASLVASLVVAGLPIAGAAALVDALPGDGAAIERRPTDADWRAGLTPLPPQTT